MIGDRYTNSDPFEALLATRKRTLIPSDGTTANEMRKYVDFVKHAETLKDMLKSSEELIVRDALFILTEAQVLPEWAIKELANIYPSYISSIYGIGIIQVAMMNAEKVESAFLSYLTEKEHLERSPHIFWVLVLLSRLDTKRLCRLVKKGSFSQYGKSLFENVILAPKTDVERYMVALLASQKTEKQYAGVILLIKNQAIIVNTKDLINMITSSEMRDNCYTLLQRLEK